MYVHKIFIAVYVYIERGGERRIYCARECIINDLNIHVPHHA